MRFRVEAVAVQGPGAALEVASALRRLDNDDEVDVIVLARGGGSIEDLLPFSDEGLCRAVAACRTAVVSAIGHEQDTPLVDLVADVRASTPTDAGKLVVPDVAEQVALVAALRQRAHRALLVRLDTEERALAALRARPVLADPMRDIDNRDAEIRALRLRAHRCLSSAVEAAAGSDFRMICSSLPRASADGHRSSGFFASAFITAAMSCGGRFATCVSMGVGSSFRIFRMTAVGAAASNGL